MLFNNDEYFFMNNMSDFGIDLNTYEPDNTRKVELYDAEEGFLRGNMFKSLYDEYRYQPVKPEIITERERLLHQINIYDFAINDLNLYLDLYPKDEYVFSMFKKYIMAYEKAKKEYISKFGPLCLTDTVFSKYSWIDEPWPWDDYRRSTYV